jgi:hypothetical protein
MKRAMSWSLAAAAMLAMAAGGAVPAGAQEGIIIPHEKIIRVPAAGAAPASKFRQRQPAAPSAQKMFKGGAEPKAGHVIIHDFHFTHTLDKAALRKAPRLLDKAGNSAARQRK